MKIQILRYHLHLYSRIKRLRLSLFGLSQRIDVHTLTAMAQPSKQLSQMEIDARACNAYRLPTATSQPKPSQRVNRAVSSVEGGAAVLSQYPAATKSNVIPPPVQSSGNSRGYVNVRPRIYLAPPLECIRVYFLLHPTLSLLCVGIYVCRGVIRMYQYLAIYTETAYCTLRVARKWKTYSSFTLI